MNANYEHPYISTGRVVAAISILTRTRIPPQVGIAKVPCQPCANTIALRCN